jgi:hypothetical protein
VKDKPMYLEADIKIEKETDSMREKASSVIDLPKGKNKQPDLLYFSAIFVSSGENLNHAFFLPSELVKAEGTIVNKALDVEHKEEEIIGHIYDRAFINKDGNKVEIRELASMETSSLEQQDLHVVVAGIIYGSRFPDIAKEVSEKKWRVSMEAYFCDDDLKIGNLFLSKKEAEMLGLASINDVIGKFAKVIKKGKEIADGTIARVLRGITFSGCGIVKNPANPPSVILETANKVVSANDDEDSFLILDLDDLENKLTSSNIDDTKNETNISVETSDITYKDTVGICVNYKKRLVDSAVEGPDTEVVRENWCTMYNKTCSSFSRSANDPDCLRYKDAVKAAKTCVKAYAKKIEQQDKRNMLLIELERALAAADKFIMA